jgi:hypothetical protein
MKMPKRSHPSPAMVLAALALVFAMVGTAVAGPGAISSKITKAKVKKIAKKQINKAAPGLSVAHADTATSATNATNANNATNATNANNAANATNLAGKSAPDVVRWANINADGTLGSGFGLESSTSGTGEYYVTATEPIEDCAAVVTPLESGGRATTFPGLGPPSHTSDPNSYNIHRFDTAGALTNAATSVAVFC